MKITCQDKNHINQKIVGVCGIQKCQYPSRLVCKQCIETEAHGQKHWKQVITIQQIMQLQNKQNGFFHENGSFIQASPVKGQQKISSNRERLGSNNSNNNSLNYDPDHFIQNYGNIHHTFPFSNLHIQVCDFLKQNLEVALDIQKLKSVKNDIFKQVDNMFDLLDKEMLEVSKQLRLSLKLKSELKLNEAANSIKQFSETYTNSVGLQDINDFLKKYENQKLSHNSLMTILGEHFEQFYHSEKWTQLMYEKFTEGGLNHNYLDVFNFDLRFFENFKNGVLSKFSDINNIYNTLPQNILHSQVPISNGSTLRVDDFERLNQNNNQKTIQTNQHIIEAKNFDQSQILALNQDYQLLLLQRNGSYIRKFLKENSDQIGLYEIYRQDLNPSMIAIIKRFKPQVELYNPQSQLLNIIPLHKNQQIQKLAFIQAYTAGTKLKSSCLIVILDQEGVMKILTTSGKLISELKTQSLYFTHFFEQDGINPVNFNNFIATEYVVTVPKRKFIEVRNPISNSLLSRLKIKSDIENELFSFNKNFQISVLKISKDEQNILSETYNHKNSLKHVIICMINDEIHIFNWKNGSLIKKVSLNQHIFNFKFLFISTGQQFKHLLLLFKDDYQSIIKYDWINGSIQNYEVSKKQFQHGFQIISEQLNSNDFQDIIIADKNSKFSKLQFNF